MKLNGALIGVGSVLRLVDTFRGVTTIVYTPDLGWARVAWLERLPTGFIGYG